MDTDRQETAALFVDDFPPQAAEPLSSPAEGRPKGLGLTAAWPGSSRTRHWKRTPARGSCVPPGVQAAVPIRPRPVQPRDVHITPPLTPRPSPTTTARISSPAPQPHRGEPAMTWVITQPISAAKAGTPQVRGTSLPVLGPGEREEVHPHGQAPDFSRSDVEDRSVCFGDSCNDG